MPCRNAREELMGPERPKVSSVETHGAGTELKALLSRVGIVAKDGCGCDAMAAQMDRKGSQWCREHAEVILDHMESVAKKRGLPFAHLAASWILEIAIKRAERKIAANAGDH